MRDLAVSVMTFVISCHLRVISPFFLCLVFGRRPLLLLGIDPGGERSFNHAHPTPAGLVGDLAVRAQGAGQAKRRREAGDLPRSRG